MKPVLRYSMLFSESVILFFCHFYASYLRGLVPIYNNATVRDLIEPLRAKADGTATVAMKNEFTRVTLQVISEVCSHPAVTHTVTLTPS